MQVAPEAGMTTRGIVRVFGLSLIAAVLLVGWIGSRWFDAPPAADVDMENLPAVELTR
ncbi:MAG TPA: hypothetical protein VFF06_12335 [Polyangia bacterium]|nr:hypothetical protein [Polyangia bacterium]